MRLLYPVIAFALSLLVFALWPDLDVRLAQWYYNPETGFFLKQQTWAVRLYDIFGKIHWVFLGGFLTILFFPQWQAVQLRNDLRQKTIFMLLALLLGPGLLVNSGFKDHWGRARPHQVQAFGGALAYTPPLQPANQCNTNCSFVSGHAAMGFFVLSATFITNRRRWLFLGLGIGAAVGFGRMVQGDHFLSDVVFAFWSVWLVSWALARTMGFKPRH